ncbi:hypothetical protein [Wenzhouxiangella marina]|uniref:Uncharacterized protein n=1 Tax=Wenzhouxiangella marina TaxID=1579979 RepID=A0A0K0XUA4_9GAMM|nr:hypothetical protein [Wenzhouxiangella marina]AKS41202.1 hypothetical protein WM2015_821 [Wenzhouxiangella marina]MBB6088081.1 hypothetical protein [Wenzhouxiangella marina]
MILRRIMEHFKDQNWTAVALDFCIVVVGVFIGIQVANWNEARTKQIDAAAARERLVSDLRADLDAYAVRWHWYEEVFDAAWRVDDVLRAEEPQEVHAMWQFVRDAWIAGGEWPFAPSAQIYKELQNAGDLDLIASGAMQRRLRDYYEDSAREIEIALTFKSSYVDLTHQLIRGRIGIAMSDCLSAASLEPSQPGTSPDLFYQDCPPPDNLALIADSSSSLYRSDALRGALNARLNRLSGLRSLLGYLDRQAASLVSDLEAAP